MSDQILRYVVVVDGKTGNVKEVKNGIDEVEKSTKKVKDSGGSAFDSLAGKAKSFAAGLLIADLAMKGLKQVASQSDAFQELQATFGEISKVLLEKLEPVLKMVSRGLQGLVVIAGGAIGAIKALIHGDWKQAMEVMAQAVEQAAERVEGATKLMTKNHLERLKVEVEAEKQHAQVLAGMAEEQIQFELGAQDLTEKRKQELLQASGAEKLRLLQAQYEAERQLLAAQLQANEITQAQHDQQMRALQKGYEDNRAAVKKTTDLSILKSEDDKNKKLRSQMQSFITAGANAAAEQIRQGKGLESALRAMAAAQIKTAADMAAQIIAAKGAAAAASAFEKAASNAPPYAAAAAGAAAAAPVIAWYGALAGTVSAVGSLAADAVAGGGAGSAGPGGAGGGQDGGNDMAGAGAAAGQANGTPVAAGPGVPAGGGPNIVYVYLDGNMILRYIGEASRDGRLMIYQRAIVGG